MQRATSGMAEEKIRHSKPLLPLADQLLEAGLNASGMPAVLYAPNDEIAYISDAYRELIGAPDNAECFNDLVHHWHANDCGPQMHVTAEEWIKKARTERRQSAHRSYEIRLTDGRWFLVNETVLAGGWLWNFLTEITQFKTAEQELELSRDLARQDAETDPLTGIFNRRFAVDELEAKVKLARSSGQPLSIAIIDLDRFKEINDNYGHDAGDEVLCHFVVTASWLLRRTDTFARVGGEEFLLIMPGATAEETRAIVERIRVELAASPLKDPDIDYTFSSGVATCHEDSAKTLLKRADAALYRAKAGGRNCTRIS